MESKKWPYLTSVILVVTSPGCMSSAPQMPPELSTLYIYKNDNNDDDKITDDNDSNINSNNNTNQIYIYIHTLNLVVYHL